MNDEREMEWSTSHWGDTESTLPQLDTRLMRLLLEHFSASFAVFDRDRCYLYANREALRFLGLPPEQVIGKHVAQVLEPELCEQFMPVFDRVLAGEALHTRGWTHYGKRGLRYREQIFVPFRPGGGPVQAVVLGGVDHTEHRLAEQELAQKREALRASEKLTTMGSLLAGVSHELNNPLSVVMGRARLLADKCEGHPDLLQDALRIRDAAERCGRIVRTFLNMARSKPARREAVILNEAVRSAADMLGYVYRTHDVALALHLDPGVPEISADGDQLCQVVLNLLVNAQQALADVDPPRRVRAVTGVDEAGARVWLRVSDNGPGIAAPLRARVFEPFFTTKSEGLGTGLGLAVSRSIAHEHGGELLLEDASLESGASFRLWLPLAGTIPEGDAAAPAMSRIGFAIVARVLVVDDEPELSDMIREMLEASGHEVATAGSGAVALELLREAHFDAVVSDLRMPDMDGPALWRYVRERHPGLAGRVLFITGDILSPAARQFLESSGCDGLEKPFAKADLLAKVAALLQRGAERND